MRTTDERMEAVFGRARQREVTVRRRRQQVVTIGGGVLSAVVVVAVGMGVALVGSPDAASLGGPFGLMGSVFSEGSAMGYIVVGLLGLILGATVTALAFQFGRYSGKRDDEGRSL